MIELDDSFYQHFAQELTPVTSFGFEKERKATKMVTF